MTTACAVNPCARPADILYGHTPICAHHYRQSGASPYDWPTVTTQTLLDGLAATRKADQEARDRRHFGKGEG